MNTFSIFVERRCCQVPLSVAPTPIIYTPAYPLVAQQRFLGVAHANRSVSILQRYFELGSEQWHRARHLIPPLSPVTRLTPLRKPVVLGRGGLT